MNEHECQACGGLLSECVNYVGSEGALQEIKTGRWVCLNYKCKEYKKPKELKEDNK